MLTGHAQKRASLAEPFDYGQPPVADVPDTGVTVNVNDKSYTQGANALGGDFSDEKSTQAQIEHPHKAVEDSVDSMSDLETLIGPQDIGPEQPFVITGWLRPRDGQPISCRRSEPAPTVVAWPVSISSRSHRSVSAPPSPVVSAPK